MIESISDADLVRQATNGHRSAYDDLVRRYAGKMFALCVSRISNRSLAEDMVQETFLRGYRNLRTLEDPTKFGSWLYGIALRTCLDWLKSKKRTEVPLSALGDSWDGPYASSYAGESNAEREEPREKVFGALTKIPEEYRDVVYLYYFDKRPYREIAETLGIAPATVNLRLSKARAMLRDLLKGSA